MKKIKEVFETNIQNEHNSDSSKVLVLPVDSYLSEFNSIFDFSKANESEVVYTGLSPKINIGYYNALSPIFNKGYYSGFTPLSNENIYDTLFKYSSNKEINSDSFLKGDLFKPKTNGWIINFDEEIEVLSSAIKKESVLDEVYIENELNNSRLNYLHSQITNKYLKIIKEEEYEFGYLSKSDELIMDLMKINSMATLTWLNDLFVKYYSDIQNVRGIMRSIARLKEDVVGSIGYTMAISAMAHNNDEVKELGIRAFENWCSMKSLNILKNTNFNSVWLQDYIEDVIKDFNSSLCPSM